MPSMRCGRARRLAGFCVMLVSALLGWCGAAVGAQVTNPHGVAVIIGNRTYAGDIPEVEFAHRDAEAFRRYVVDVLGFDPENIIDLRDATQAEMWSTFGSRTTAERSDLWSWLNEEHGSDVVVYYSGHGVPGLKDRRGYLLPSNADPNTVEINGYPIDVLYENLGKLTEARSVVVYLDACFSGDSDQGMLVRSASPVYVSAALPEEAGERLLVLTAASGEQLASWDREAGHGLFTHHLLDALYGGGDADGDGEVTAREAKQYLDRHMRRAARRTYGRHQDAGLNGLPETVLSSALGGDFPARPVLPKEADEDDGPKTPAPDGEPKKSGPSALEMEEELELTREERKWVQRGLSSSGLYEVTVGEWKRFVDDTGHSTGSECWTYEDGEWKERTGRSWRRPGYEQGDDHPVVCVSWRDAQSYVRWLRKKTGKGYRLLSESEWEYVARGGSETARYWGESERGQCRYVNGADKAVKRKYGGWTIASCDDGYVHTAPVGSYQPNKFGVHDVLGNVVEWVEDCWNGSYRGAPSDGSAWESGDCSRRVLRGGSWYDRPRFLRSAYRGWSTTGDRSSDAGFRVVRTL